MAIRIRGRVVVTRTITRTVVRKPSVSRPLTKWELDRLVEEAKRKAR